MFSPRLSRATTAGALALATACGLVPAVASPAGAADEPAPIKVYESQPFGLDEGYACFRIPSVIKAANGDLLVFAEGRKDDCSDDTHIDIVMKRSHDGGATWPAEETVVVVGTNDTLANGNPSPVVDRASGRISLVYATSPVHDRVKRSVRVVNSDDNGSTWTADRAVGTKPADWGWTSVGPGHGIQLAQGAHAGRLVVTGDHQNQGKTRGGAQLYVSDDGGRTWRMTGTTDESLVAAPGEPLPQAPNEIAVVERADGSLYFNARDKNSCGYNERRLAAESTDGGDSFTTAFKAVTDLDAPPVFGSLLRLHDRILFSASNRSGGTVLDRQDLTIRSTTDGGGTWSGRGTRIVPGLSGYSDLAALSPDKVGMVYEWATKTPHGYVRFTTFDDAQLKNEETVVRERRTTDTAGLYRDHPAVRGGPVPATRGAGKALAFDGVDDYLETTTCSSDLAVGASDFTVTAWFRYGATSGSHTILWAYGQGPDEPQFWLRAEPGADQGKGRIHALVDTGTADAVDVAVPGAFNDPAWHLVVLTREGQQLRLSVDGVTAVSAAGRNASGAITPAGPPVLRVGTRPDGADRFTGALDEIRLFARALTPAEATSAGNSQNVDATAERLRLGFSSLWN
ncbi:exo-alpha-sialidase [Streptomyces sp. NPDC053493]|uniref:exo-alpha-sialidase n=1 Tax=Streptomyces sp. NPDC053493 TaxID=3365705 RepID=UPI0037D0D998